jgi:hypothetical protein
MAEAGGVGQSALGAGFCLRFAAGRLDLWPSQRFAAASFPRWRRSSSDSTATPLGTLAFPPSRPRATAAGFFRFAMFSHIIP